MRHARDSRLAGARPNLQNYFGWLAPAPGRIGMMRNIFPHGKIDVPSEVVAAGPSLVAPGVSGVHRDFQRVQDLYHNKHEPAGRRLRRARIIRARIITACHIDSAVGDTPTGLGVVEIAKLPDKPPQTLVALAPRRRSRPASVRAARCRRRAIPAYMIAKPLRFSASAATSSAGHSLSIATAPAVVVSRAHSDTATVYAAMLRSAITCASDGVACSAHSRSLATAPSCCTAASSWR